MDYKYISNELTHWTGRSKTDDEAFQVLKRIFESRLLKLSQCYTGPKKDKEYGISPAEYMTCFTDVPLNLSSHHCNTFGKVGISFKKDKFIPYGAQPVFYYLSHMAGSINNFVDLVFDKLNILEKSKEEFVDVTEYESLRRLLSFVQTYDYRQNDYSDNPNYYQREWRIVFDGSRISDNLDTLRPGLQYLDILNGCAYFCFDNSDVESIIVPEKFKDEASKLIIDKRHIKLNIYEKL